MQLLQRTHPKLCPDHCPSQCLDVEGLPLEDGPDAFRELRTIPIFKPLVHYPQPELPYVLITDACQGDAKKPGGVWGHPHSSQTRW